MLGSAEEWDSRLVIPCGASPPITRCLPFHILPQIAARAHHHIVVAKGAKGGVTTADITVLSSVTA